MIYDYLKIADKVYHDIIAGVTMSTTPQPVPVEMFVTE